MKKIMNIIICLDKSNGISFNNRRQSRDREVVYDILRNCKNSKIWMNSYSKEMFDESLNNIKVDVQKQDLKKIMEDNINVDELFLDKAEEEDYCFVESGAINDYKDRIDKIILYRWDKAYPQDEVFDINGYSVNNIEEIKGYSHDMIIREIYVKIVL